MLSAFGCGAFRNPRIEVAELFLAALSDYAGYFREVCHYSEAVEEKVKEKESWRRKH